MKTQPLSPKHSKALVYKGFTLVELLAVIGIIATLMTVGIIGMKSASSTKGPGAGIAIVESLIDQARNKAIAEGQPVRLLIHAEHTPLAQTRTSRGAKEASRYLRYICLAQQIRNADRTLSDTWEVTELGIFLPEDTYFHPELSSRGGAPVQVMTPSIELPGRKEGTTECYYYEFDAQGFLVEPRVNGSNSTARVVISGGGIREDGSSRPLPVQINDNERNYDGIVIWSTGRTSTILDLDEIDGGSSQ